MLEIGIALLFSIVLLYSGAFNPRLTEDVTHPVWNVILFNLCGKHLGRFLPTPQFRIYNSPHDRDAPSNADTSMQTVADKDARGVITDFCILMPVLAVRKKTPGYISSINLTCVEDLINAVAQKLFQPPHIPYPTARVSSLFAPLLAELKRPVSRHTADVLHYLLVMEGRLHNAQSQAMLQAQCLFSSPKYAEQQRVILIAATGEWWTARIVPRSHYEDQFDITEYRDAENVEKTHEASSDELDGVEADLCTPGTPTKKMTVASAAKARESEEAQVKKQKEERNQRALRRASDNEASDEENSALNNFLVDTKLGYYDEETLNKCYRLWKACRNPPKKCHLGLAGVQYANPGSGSIEKALAGGWPAPMRIGSPASNAYFTFIKDQLQTFSAKKKD